MGLHRRYARLLAGADRQLMAASAAEVNRISEELSHLFRNLMKVVHSTAGASFSVELLATDQAQAMIGAHAAALDSSFRKVEMSEAMRRRLHRSDYIFSGMKVFHEMNEAFPALVGSDGNIKPFEQFYKEVSAIHDRYNRHYLRAEYNFVHASAQMAARWEEFAADGDDYNLQYRTAGDNRVREEHRALDGVTLPFSDPFWEEFLPPNGWNCRCSVVQVRKSKYPVTDAADARRRGEQALQRDTRGMFRFNPGAQQKTVPDYNPYTISACRSCPVAKGKSELAKSSIPQNQLCEACRFLRSCEDDRYYSSDPVYGDRLKIHATADKSELKDNKRAAEVILNDFPEANIKIRPHVLIHGVKNPEYEINGLIADRKGIKSEDGVTDAFRKAKVQGCTCVVIDLDMRFSRKNVKWIQLAQKIKNRKLDFEKKLITECYIVYNGKAVRINGEDISNDTLNIVLKKLEP